MPQKLTTVKFIQKANLRHNNKYNYSKVNYINSQVKITINCPEHGDFLQIPHHHLSGSGCSQCSKNKKLTTQEFIKKANKIHNNKYDYSKVNYKNYQTKIIIICKKHNEFKQSPNSHLNGNGNGCPKCNKNTKITTQEFIDKANEIHKNKYDYSKTIYINALTKVIIICSQHGEFLQMPSVHYRSGCKKCGNKITRNKNNMGKDKFIDKANKIHKNKYDYSKVNYINSQTKITIMCSQHGEFIQTPQKHLQKRGCPKCANKKLSLFFRLSKEDFIIKAQKYHGTKYDYSKVQYINAHKLITIICPKHGEFIQEPNVHMRGGGCQRCSNIGSKAERIWLDQIEKKQNIKIIRDLIIYIDGKKFHPDGFHEPTNTWYEYHGSFFHGNPKFYNPDDINPRTKTTFKELYNKTLKKETLIKSAGYNLIVKWGN